MLYQYILSLKLGFALIFVFNIYSMSAIGKDIENSKVLHFFQENKNLGDVFEGQVASSGYVCKNVSNKPVQLKTISGSCSCSHGKLPKKLIKPGEETIIMLEMHTKGKIGFSQDDFTIEYIQNGKPYKHQLRLSANIINDGKITSNPRSLHFDAVKNTNLKKKFLLKRMGSNAFATNIVDIKTPPWIKIESLEKDPNLPSWTLKLDVLTPSRVGNLIDVIQIHTDNPIFATTEIPIIANITSEIKAVPSSIVKYLRADEPTPEISVTVEDIKNRELEIINAVFKSADKPFKTKNIISKNKKMVTLTFNDRITERVLRGKVKIQVQIDGQTSEVPVDLLFLTSTSRPDLKND